KPGEIVGDITPVKGLMATQYQVGETIATLVAMTSDGNDVFAVAGDYDAKDYDDASITWSIVGKNDPQHKIKVKFEAQRSSIRGEKYKYGAHTWMIYPNGEAILIKTAVAKEIAADVYPLTMHLAMYYK
ncbi:hypothetical protein ACSIZT_004444, partial [Yersinia enterocolitica]|nr:hypothetical protein [Yersinia enterocolitica]